MLLLTLILCGGAFLAGCSLTEIKQQAPAASPSIPNDARPAPLRLAKIDIDIPRGTQVGSISPRGLHCGGPYGRLDRGDVVAMAQRKTLKEAFHDTLSSNGYDVTGGPSLQFGVEADLLRTHYRIGARIIDIKMDLCRQTGLLFRAGDGLSGEAEMTVAWQVYDRLHRKLAYEVTTRGYAARTLPDPEGAAMLFDASFAAAAHNLGADEAFNALIVQGRKPAKRPQDKSAANLITAKMMADAPVTIDPPPVEKTTRADWTHARNATVLVEAGEGHGSGLFISSHGHILTTAHVVGGAARVRITPSKGQGPPMIANVLRRDPGRDVALLLVHKLPDGFAPALQPLRTEIPDVGADIYAIGAPLHARALQDTLTKGILSAYREKSTYTPYPVIQGDVDIHAGNSGGPLLDKYGNIIGLAVAGYGADPFSTGLNQFVPISSALERLNIRVKPGN